MGLIVAALLALSQDGAGIRELIQRLDDDRLEAREQAQRSLLDLGDAALAPLSEARKAASGETAVRIDEVLRQLDLALKVRSVYREIPRITLKAADRAFADVLADLARQTGLKFDAGAVNPKHLLTLDLADAPLLQVLDRLCEGRFDCTHEAGVDSDVRFLAEPHPVSPASYDGPFRVRAVQVHSLRGTDFRAVKTSATVTLLADWERQLKPAPSPAWEIRRAWDDRNNPLETTRTTSNFTILPGVGNLRMRINLMGGVVGGGSGSAPHALVVTGLDPAARRFGLEGCATFAFPLDPKTLRFDHPGAEQVQECGDSAFTLRKLGTGPLWQLSVAPIRGNPAGWAESIPGRLTLEAVTAVDADGTEFTGRLQPVSASGRGLETDLSVTYQLILNRVGKPLKEIRFPFVSQVHLKEVPFELRDIPVP